MMPPVAATVSDRDKAEFMRQIIEESEYQSRAESAVKGKKKEQILSLPEVIQMAIVNNYEMKIARIEPEVKQREVEAEWAEFSPRLELGVSLSQSNDPQNAQELAATGGNPADILNGQPRIFYDDRWEGEFGLRGRTPIGLEYGLVFQGSALENTTNQSSTLSLFSPEFETFAGVTLNQPLLRNLGFDAQLKNVRVARVNRAIAVAELKERVSSNLAQLLDAYYSYLASWEEWQARQSGIAMSEKVREQQLDQVERGVLSMAEVAQVEIELSENRREAFEARNRATAAKLALLKLILNEFDAMDPESFVPVDRLDGEIPSYKVEELVRWAMVNRPDYQRAMEVAKRENLEIKYQENQSLPRLDLEGSFGYNGLDRGFGDSVDRAVDRQGEQWKVGVKFSMPIGPNPNIDKARAARLRKEQALLNIKDVETSIHLDIHFALEQMEVSKKRLQSARKMLQSAETLLTSQQDQVERGTANVDDVARVYVAYVQAKAEHARALGEVRRAVAQVWMSSGLMLHETKVTIESY
ncbi:MAG: TolC family protein [Blastochloris sp.]|nr:TolC family protein [Blastochloris sp.]